MCWSDCVPLGQPSQSLPTLNYHLVRDGNTRNYNTKELYKNSFILVSRAHDFVARSRNKKLAIFRSMALYLDSALISDAQLAMQWGWVSGITTNPTLLAQSDRPPAQVLSELKALCPGEIYYQLLSPDQVTMEAEAQLALKILGPQLVLKIPATPVGFTVTARLSSQIPCAVTGIYHPSQAKVAQAAGAACTIAYVNRATRLLGDGIQLVAAMAAALQGSSTQILAASLKSPDEAIAALQAGAEHLTLPLALLEQLASHPLSDQTVTDFKASGQGLLS
jgi:transaldolase